MPEPSNYAEKVYAGVLGKVVGVYVGKPFEGWLNKDIERRLGEIWYYVHDRLNYPLVLADDDISGTFTFLRALEDHEGPREKRGLAPFPSSFSEMAPVPLFSRAAGPGKRGQAHFSKKDSKNEPVPFSLITSEQIGRTWLNYLIEHQTVLWWGGMGVSTEHTAWLRLAAGVPAPRSGSIELNGRTVAEQIGAQIFIDGFGLVAPGEPELAARLAGEAARVSHDGEAVHAAQAVAAMEAAAFVEPDMGKLLDVGLSVMPKDCLIARLHHDVRGWAGKFGNDWRKTLARIQAKYGYDTYRGGCHVVPNHAVMVMAWAHAPDDFQKALMIANTAGWDTDCNSGNVGCLMGVKVGLAGIAAGPDWQRPFADRVLIPTAEGTHGVSDCLRQADLVTRLGRRVMGWASRPAPKKAARFHFSLPGSMHGFLPVREIATEDNVRVCNPAGLSRLRIEFANVAPGKPARIVTPTFLTPDQIARSRGSYTLAVAPTLYSGQTITAALAAPAGNAQPVNVRLFAQYYQPNPKPDAEPRAVLTGLAASEPVRLAPGKSARLTWAAPDTSGWPIALLGLQIETSGRKVMWDSRPRLSLGGKAAEFTAGELGSCATSAAGAVELDWLTWSGAPTIRFGDMLRPAGGRPTSLGWICNCTLTHRDTWGAMTLVSNRGLGLLHTGTADWADYAVSGKIAVRLADRAGLAARYGGLYRYVALVFNRVERVKAKRLQLIRQFDDERTVLASAPCEWGLNEMHTLKLAVRGRQATGFADGKRVLHAEFAGLPAGGVACLTDNGTTSFDGLAVKPR